MKGTKKTVENILDNKYRVIAVLSVTIITWLLFLMVSRPAYSYQMLTASFFQLDNVIAALVWNQNATSGILGIMLPIAIALLVGILAVNTGISLLQNYNSTGTLSSSLGGLMGFAGAGCASCGAGLLTLIGLSGGVAILPFNGLGIQAVSVIILLASLEYTGRQDQVCKID